MPDRTPDRRRPVSVAMATYNGIRFVREQIDSILENLRDEDELVIVDDGSGDGTPELLASIPDARLRVLRNPANLGVRRSFERALSTTRHDIVFLADQDDVWEPGKRDTVVAAFDADPDVMVVISDARLIDETGAVVQQSFMAGRGGFRGGVFQTLLRNRYLGCAMAVRRAVLQVALPIPLRAPMHDMWIGAIAARLGTVRFVPQPLLRYRRHSGNVSPLVTASMLRAIRWRFDLSVALIARTRAVARHSRRRDGR